MWISHFKALEVPPIKYWNKDVTVEVNKRNEPSVIPKLIIQGSKCSSTFILQTAWLNTWFIESGVKKEINVTNLRREQIVQKLLEVDKEI